MKESGAGEGIKNKYKSVDNATINSYTHLKLCHIIDAQVYIHMYLYWLFKNKL